jgi:hypothetical protein
MNRWRATIRLLHVLLLAVLAGAWPAESSAQAIDGEPVPSPTANPHTSPHTSRDPIRATSERGLVAEVIVVDAEQPLRAKPEQPLTAPVLVRVSEASAPTGRAFRVEFIGAVAGEYDLRDYLEFVDGTPATTLAPIRVRVESQLPASHGSDLFAIPEPPFRLESHYRNMLIAVGVLWLLIPIAVLIRRRLRRPPVVVVEPPAPPPTLADVLRPLVERAQGQGLSLREQAALELLLLHYWRDRLGLGDAPAATAIASIRRHPEAGTLMRAVERWLHARGAGDARPAEDIATLLAPYAAVDAPQEWPPQTPRDDRSESATSPAEVGR